MGGESFFLLSPSVNGQPPNVSSFSNSAGGLTECPDLSTVRMRDRDMRREGLHSHVLAAFSFSKRSAIKKNKELKGEEKPDPRYVQGNTGLPGEKREDRVGRLRETQPFFFFGCLL